MFLHTVDELFSLILQVVDLINKSPSDLRPTVFVSATAVGYYGMCFVENLVCILLQYHQIIHSS